MRSFSVPLACLVLILCNSARAAGDTSEAAVTHAWQLCRNPESMPLYQALNPEHAATTQGMPSDISADSINILQQGESVFSGQVELRQGTQWLSTDTLYYNHESQSFHTQGLVRFQNDALRMNAESAQGNNRTNTIELNKLNYQFHKNNGNGHAEQVTVVGDSSVLKQANFSTCPPNQKQWQFVADEIRLDEATHKGHAKNARLQIGSVPIFWLPLLTFPTSNQRASGILTPRIGQDRLNGLDVSLPIYLNLAPNYDATLTPRFMSNRGLMLETEFRYLFGESVGQLNTTYLHNDELRGIDRSLIKIKHFSPINTAWFFNADLNHVSDRNYFSDFGNTLNDTSTALLNSDIGFHGRGKYWTIDLSASQWQIANPLQVPGSEPYKRLPRLQVHGAKPLTPWFEFGVDAEAVAFRHDQLTDGDRLDITPYIKMPFTGSNWYVTPRLSWRQTEYWLHHTNTDQQLSRGLSILSVDAGASYERTTRFAQQDLIQTLEPRVFYLRVPYKDQTALPVFDTQALTFMWPSLFRDNRYGGADRQSDANQLTLALNSRFLDLNSGQERMSYSLGRILYFTPPKVHLPNEPLPQGNGSAWVGEASYHMTDQWQLDVAQHWQSDHGRTELSSIRSTWKLNSGLQLSTSYHYRKDTAEQTDLAFVLPINGHWQALGRWSYSLRDQQNLEALLGFEWKSCCIAFRVFGRQYTRSFDSRSNTGLFVELELNGLGQLGRSPDILKENGILAY